MEALDIDEFRKYAARFAHQVLPKQSEATVVTLSGDLGAGKTTFVQGVARALGIQENVTSPTFVIEKIYNLSIHPPAGGFARLIHIDAYRLESEDELKVLGFSELLQDATNLILIEWPEKIPTLIPKSALKIRFDIADDGRIITTNGQGEKGKN